MKKTTKIAAVALAAAIGCTMFAGCDLLTTNAQKDYNQVIAEVNIAASDDFKDGGRYAQYSDVIETSTVSKRDMVAYFVSSGYSYMQNNGLSYYDTFNMIVEALTNQQIYLQYAKVYLLENGDADGKTYSAEEYRAAVAAAESDEDKTLAGLTYFLNEEEQARAKYSVRVMFNNTIDSQEQKFITADSETSASASVRATPTGIDTENEDYYDPAYRVYTGGNTLASCGTYEAQEGSTAYTRRRGYNEFLGSLYSNNLLSSGENVSDIESLSYFKLELRGAYEDALFNKLSEKFEAEIEESITEQSILNTYTKALRNQSAYFAEDEEAFEEALDGMSDSSFVLTAPAENYGFVYNILLPFSQIQSAVLEAEPGDAQGNKFGIRAELLQKLRATDQRSSWFTGETDYSFDGSSEDGVYTGGSEDRKYLFFENSLRQAEEGTVEKYERVKNYYGKYTFNGAVSKNLRDEYVITPAPIDIDAFLAEMEGYVNSVDGISAAGSYYLNNAAASGADFETGNAAYYTDTAYYKQKADGSNAVAYENFVYYQGKVDFGGTFDPNRIFVAGSAENNALSAINELSFAYNTDTAGLNTYLGYAVSIAKTDFVSEFEYAAQLACEGGAGTYVVVPSDYGWHIIYCTFSFKADDTGVIQPFRFNWAEKDEEGTFSNLYYETIRQNEVDRYTNVFQTYAISGYVDCVTLYEDRYADLTGLDTAV